MKVSQEKVVKLSEVILDIVDSTVEDDKKNNRENSFFYSLDIEMKIDQAMLEILIDDVRKIIKNDIQYKSMQSESRREKFLDDNIYSTFLAHFGGHRAKIIELTLDAFFNEGYLVFPIEGNYILVKP